jgi:WD40 repeat protein
MLRDANKMTSLRSRSEAVHVAKEVHHVRGLELGADGQTLATSSDDRTLKLWEAAPAAALACQ